MKAAGIKIYHLSKWMLFALLISLALLSIAGRVLLDNVMHFKSDIVAELAGFGIKGVELENIEGHWQGLHPVLKIKGASLSLPGESHALYISELSLRVKLVPSLLSGNLLLHSLHSTIQKIILVRDHEGLWWLNDIPFTAQTKTEARLDLHAFFQRLPAFSDIEIGQIQLRDQRTGSDYLIQHTSLRNSRKNEQLAMQLSAQLPASLGSQLELSLQGDASRQQVYVQAKTLNLAALIGLLSMQSPALEKAHLSVQSWLSLERFQLKKVVTQANLSSLVLNRAQASGPAISAQIHASAESQSAGWRINSRLQNIQQGAQHYSDVHTQLLIGHADEKPVLWIDQLELSLISEIVSGLLQDEQALQWLSGLQAQGQLSDIVAQLESAAPKQSLLEFDFKRLQSTPYRSIPGLSGVDGHVLFAQGRAQLELEAKQLTVDFADLFRAPLQLDVLRSSAFIEMHESAINVASDHFELANSDLKLAGRLWLEIPASGRAFMSLRAHYQDGDIGAVSRYLPVKIMPQKVVQWLDESIQGGRLTEGDFLFHGRLVNPSVLHKNSSGIMHASLQIQRPQLTFLKDWPAVTRGEGRLDFINASLQGDLKQVHFAASQVDRVQLEIADFLNSRLSIQVDTKSTAQSLLDTLSRLPILQVFKEVKAKTSTLSGQVQTQLKLDIPLSPALKHKLSVQATARLQDVALNIPSWMVDFSQMSGVVNIENEAVSANALTGRYYGDPVRLSVVPDPKHGRTGFQMSGKLQSQHLLQLVPEYLRQPVSGVSSWNIAASVAHQADQQQPLLKLSARSDLAGTRLEFPEPARILAEQPQNLLFDAELSTQGEFMFDLDLSAQLKAHGKLDLSDKARSRMQYLTVGLGGNGDSHEHKGISITGNVKQLNVSNWIDYIGRYFNTKSDDPGYFLRQINFMDLTIDQLLVRGQQAMDSRLQLTNNGSLLQGILDSTLVKGTFELPFSMDQQHPLVADLEYINLVRSTSPDKIQLKVSDMPDLLITSKTIAYEDMIFSDLILSTRAQGNSFLIDQLDFSRDQVQLKSSGKWQFDPLHKDHVSVFNIDVKGKNFGQTVQNLGLGESIKDGEVDFNGQIGWGGDLFNINWPSLLGEVSLQLEDGYLKNVEPGAGRFVGLLSFNALPKRLFLDFGDVVKEGMQFNQIKGEFSIKGEQLHTENASLDSIAAKVDISGSTNLRDQTYDQNMTITPKIGDTLPLIGTIAAGNAVGWGLLLLQKIFKKPIEKSVEIEYKVTGSWEQPQVDLIEKPKVSSESNRFNEAGF